MICPRSPKSEEELEPKPDYYKALHKIYKIGHVWFSPRFIWSSTLCLTVAKSKCLWKWMGTEQARIDASLAYSPIRRHSVAQGEVGRLYRLKFDDFSFINLLCLLLSLCKLLEYCGRKFHTVIACVQSTTFFCCVQPTFW